MTLLISGGENHGISKWSLLYTELQYGRGFFAQKCDLGTICLGLGGITATFDAARKPRP